MQRPSFFLLVAAALLCVGCAGGGGDSLPPSEALASNIVRMYLNGAPASLSLIGKTDLNGEILAVQVTDSLVQYDETLELQPRLAESWEISEDRRTVTFHLRPGVRWHDGEPVTAGDVAFTVERVRDPAVENRTWGSLFEALEAVEAPDDRTVVARYRATTPDFLEGWRVPVLPRHIAGKDSDLLSGEFAQHPVGCGPFRFVRYLPDREIQLDANDDYWDGRPTIDHLILKIFRDQRTGYQALLAGQLDIMPVSSGLWEEARHAPEAAHVEALVYRRFNAWTLGWNQDGSNPFFTDPRVRRALVLALNREQFIETVVHGWARPGITTFHPDSRWAEPRLTPRPFDPEAAQRLLDEAGWIDADGDGVRERDGTPFRFTLMIPVGTQRLVDQMAAWQQQSWSAIGVRTEIEKLEWQAFRERRDTGRFQVAAGTFLFGPGPDEQFALYHSSAREGGFNFWGFDDPEVDRLLEAARVSFDFDERRELYRALQRRLYELEALTCLFYFDSPLLHDRRLGGVVPSPLGYANTTRGPRQWVWSVAGGD